MGLKIMLQKIKDLEVVTNEPMSNHTTIGLGGKVKYYLLPSTLLSVRDAIEVLNENGIKYKIIGNGSNLLVSDSGYNGAVIDTKRLNSININKNVITAMCGVKLFDLCYLAYSLSLTGLEALVGIPATVGGAVVNNASAFSKSISDYLESVCYLENGKVKCIDKEDCKFSYRNSTFLHKNNFIISATFSFPYLDKVSIKKDMEYYKSIRNDIQPKGRNNGSIFKNTKSYSAGKLIELSGLKGYQYKGVSISTKHANFLTIENGAKSSDVYYLIQYVKKKVYDNFKIILVEEIEYLGEFQ